MEGLELDVFKPVDQGPERNQQLTLFAVAVGKNLLISVTLRINLHFMLLFMARKDVHIGAKMADTTTETIE